MDRERVKSDRKKCRLLDFFIVIVSVKENRCVWGGQEGMHVW